MTIIEHSSIKRVSHDDGLESITLRSDLAARYTFLNETLLEGIGALKVDEKFKTMLNLKEIIKDENNNLITDEIEYLRKWQEKLQKEVSQLESEQTNKPLTTDKDSITKHSDQLNEILKHLDNPIDSQDINNLTEDEILQKFDTYCATHQPQRNN